MLRSELVRQIQRKKSMLCVGLDVDINKIPSHLKSEPNPLLTFNKAIIDATANYTVAYKPNIAFYEKLGPKGWDLLAETLDYIPKDIFTIADAKRGDIGNTAKQYAQTFFETYPFDSITVAPYMGEDSVKPFLEFDGKWAIVLGLTSNQGANDFQKLEMHDGSMLFENVLHKTAFWGSLENLMFVIGATRGEDMKRVREILPHHFFLVPGVGAQGGTVEEVCQNAAIPEEGGLLINSSRGIIYADDSVNYAQAAKQEAKKLQEQMAAFL